MRLKLTLAYDGTGFRGWAAQPGLRTVEAALREALDTIFPSLERARGRGPHGHRRPRARERRERRRRRRPAASSASAEALNTALPDDVAVVSAEEAAPDFHARFSARSRTYRYRVWRSRVRSPFEARRSWWYPRPLDVGRLHAQAAFLLGEHDFRAFTPTRRSTRSSCATVRGRALARARATCSSSRSPPTRSSATWCGRSSARWSTASTSRRCSTARPRERGRTDGAAVGPLPRARCLRLTRCAFRSFSSTSTARSSTRPR